MSGVGARALLDVLRAWPEAPVGPVPQDVEAFVHAAARHGLAGFVQHALGRSGWRLEEPVRTRLRREALAQAARGMRVKVLLLRSLDALAQVGVVPVLLKGHGLAVRLYPEPLQRATTDVDLLVADAEVAPASRVLEGLRLKPLAEEAAAHAREHEHHLTFSGAAGLVELHFRALVGYGQALEADALLARAQEAVLEGRRVRYLRAEDELVYLALHASNHLLQRLSWLFDLKLLMRAHPGLDWGRVVEVARGTAFPHLAWYALDAARRLVGAPVPEETLAALAPPSWQRMMAARFFTAERLLETELMNHKPAWVVAKLLLAPRLLPMARYTARRLREDGLAALRARFVSSP
ncbi:nucleotidyltransferase family protein [Archangium violaceum]|uniref:nucleotidyltransferase family protein n=1 Tax=Archangium violaceum TaxID=83451 RepID=UPI001EF61B2C|nr:nucleotidyltransferase family protein [Archangium violaceum]